MQISCVTSIGTVNSSTSSGGMLFAPISFGEVEVNASHQSALAFQPRGRDTADESLMQKPVGRLWEGQTELLKPHDMGRLTASYTEIGYIISMVACFTLRSMHPGASLMPAADWRRTANDSALALWQEAMAQELCGKPKPRRPGGKSWR